MNREEIVLGVRECVARVVDQDVAAVRVEDRVIDDLGADSLDLLDLVFQLEQRFKIKISPRGIEKSAQERLEGAPLEIDGVYTPEALAELRTAMPEVPAEELCPGLRTAHLPHLFRVATFVGLVSKLLENAECGVRNAE
jgi:acyl carrier protein